MESRGRQTVNTGKRQVPAPKHRQKEYILADRQWMDRTGQDRTPPGWCALHQEQGRTDSRRDRYTGSGSTGDTEGRRGRNAGDWSTGDTDISVAMTQET